VKNNTYPVNMTDISGTNLDLPISFANGTQGPRGVTYTLSTVSGDFTVTATENGTDAFGSTGTTDTGTFDLATNIYTGL
jgi:hypothetical protein